MAISHLELREIDVLLGSDAQSNCATISLLVFVTCNLCF